MNKIHNTQVVHSVSLSVSDGGDLLVLSTVLQNIGLILRHTSPGSSLNKLLILSGLNFQSTSKKMLTK